MFFHRVPLRKVRKSHFFILNIYENTILLFYQKCLYYYLIYKYEYIFFLNSISKFFFSNLIDLFLKIILINKYNFYF